MFKGGDNEREKVKLEGIEKVRERENKGRKRMGRKLFLGLAGDNERELVTKGESEIKGMRD